MGIIYLTVDQVLRLHDSAIDEHGGLAGVRSQHALHSAVGQVEQSVFGEDAYETLAEKAAAYAFFITTGHPFNDGNKRTAAAALETFLDLNGYELQQTDDEFESMIVSLAAGEIDQGEFCGWVVNHATPKREPTRIVKLR